MSEERNREPDIFVPDWACWRRFLLQFIVATLALAGLLLIARRSGIDTGYGVHAATLLAMVLFAVFLFAAVSNPARPAHSLPPQAGLPGRTPHSLVPGQSSRVASLPLAGPLLRYYRRQPVAVGGSHLALLLQAAGVFGAIPWHQALAASIACGTIALAIDVCRGVRDRRARIRQGVE